MKKHLETSDGFTRLFAELREVFILDRNALVVIEDEVARSLKEQEDRIREELEAYLERRASVPGRG